VADSTESCTAGEHHEEALRERVLDVNAACCEQEGEFTCERDDGIPWECVQIRCPASSLLPRNPLFCRPGNARCSVSFVPFYDECFDERTVTTVDQLTKYTLLYEQCANQPEREVRAMIGSIDAMIENPMCRVNVTGILPRGENISIQRQHSSDAASGGECVDDDEMGKSRSSREFHNNSNPHTRSAHAVVELTGGMESSCTAVAASDIGCDAVGMADACQCSCRTQASGGAVTCHDNNRGLAEMCAYTAVLTFWLG